MAGPADRPPVEYALGKRLWANPRLPWGIESLRPRKFGRQVGATFYLESDGWATVIAPTTSGPESWKTRRLTDKGWTPDGEGTAADPQAAEQAADQHIADRTAPEPSQPDEQPERQPPPRTETIRTRPKRSAGPGAHEPTHPPPPARHHQRTAPDTANSATPTGHRKGAVRGQPKQGQTLCNPSRKAERQ